MKTKLFYLLLPTAVICVCLFTITPYALMYRDSINPFSNSPTENEGPATATSIVKTSDSDYARFGEYTQNYKIISDTNENTRSFILINEEDKITSTLTLSNPRYGPPNYRIVKGKKHDWLVVTMLAGSGTGYRSDEDEWYLLDSNNQMTSVLSYTSYVLHSPAQEDNSKTSFLSTQVANDLTLDDTKIDINYIYKLCDINEDGNEKNCIDKSNIVNYVWSEEDEVFKLKE